MNLNRIKQAATIIKNDNESVRLYVKYCDDYNLDPDWINTTWQHKLNQSKITIRGLKKKGSLISLVCDFIDEQHQTQSTIISISNFFKFYNQEEQ